MLIIGFLLQTLSLALAAVLVFLFNAGLQKRLLREQNKNKLLDDLLKLLDEQSNFYGNHLDTQNDQEPRVKTNDTMRLTHFYTILVLAGEKYQLNNKDEISRLYRHFCHISTGGAIGENFGLPTQKTNKKEKVRQIHAAANKLSLMLLQNKS